MVVIGCLYQRCALRHSRFSKIKGFDLLNAERQLDAKCSRGKNTHLQQRVAKAGLVTGLDGVWRKSLRCTSPRVTRVHQASAQ